MLPDQLPTKTKSSKNKPITMKLIPIQKRARKTLLGGVILVFTIKAFALFYAPGCKVDYVEDPVCAHINGCVANCTTKQCEWGGLPITLYLGKYVDNQDVPKLNTYVTQTESGSMSQKVYIPKIPCTYYWEYECVLHADPDEIYVSACQGWIEDGDECPPSMLALK
jgi:hypothetical protein